MADFTYPERLSLARLPTPVQRLDRLSEELVKAGERPYAIPSGASTSLGALGYVAMVDELCAQHRAGAQTQPAHDQRRSSRAS